MESKKTKKLVEVPKEFDVRKYDACKEFGGAEWYTNLLHRALRLSMMRDHSDYYRDELRRSIDYFLRTPINKNIEIKEGGGFSKNVFRAQVRAMSALEFLSGKSCLYPERGDRYLDAINTWEAAVESPGNDADEERAMKVLDVPAWKMLDECEIDTSGEVHVTVDLYASEEKLVDDFRRLLRETRAAMGIPNLQKRFTQSDFDEWHQYRILAYLDLATWAEIHGVRISQQALGVALFPDEYNVGLADRVRKTVGPLARAAAAPSSIEALYSQMLEEAEPETGKSIPDSKTE